MSYLLYYYSSDAEHGSSKYKQSVTIDSNSLLQMEKDGLIKYSEKDRALLKRFQDMSDEFKQAKQEDYEALNEKHSLMPSSKGMTCRQPLKRVLMP